MTTRVRLEMPLTRKARRAMTSRRWEKKMCKALTESLGYPVLHIRNPKRKELT